MAANKYLLGVAMLVSLVGVSQQDEPIHCCVDSKFTVLERTVTASVSDNGTQTYAVMTTQISASDYDQSLMGAEVVTTNNHGETTEYRIIENFEMGYGWYIQDGHCTSFQFEGNMPDNCVPYDRDIEYLGSSRYMGFVPAQSWRMVLWPEIGQHGIVDFTVAEDGCIPISSAFRGYDDTVEPPTDIFNAVLFYNFTGEIVDPDRWFAVPGDCPVYSPNKNFKPKRVTSHASSPFFHMGSYRYKAHLAQGRQ